MMTWDDELLITVILYETSTCSSYLPNHQKYHSQQRFHSSVMHLQTEYDMQTDLHCIPLLLPLCSSILSMSSVCYHSCLSFIYDFFEICFMEPQCNTHFSSSSTTFCTSSGHAVGYYANIASLLNTDMYLASQEEAKQQQSSTSYYSNWFLSTCSCWVYSSSCSWTQYSTRDIGVSALAWYENIHFLMSLVSHSPDIFNHW